MKIFFRYLVFFILMFVMICTGLVCVIATLMAGIMIYARLRDGHLEAHDWRILRIDAEIALAAGLIAFCAFRLKRRYLDRAAAALARPGGAQPRTAAQVRRVRNFNLLVYGGGFLFCAWNLSEPGPLHGLVAAGWLAALFLGLHGRILAHELGHLAAAWIVRMQGVKFQVGTGPVLCAARSAGGMLWEWRLWPGGGLVEVFHRAEKGHRWRYWLVVLGGVAANVAVLVADARWFLHWPAVGILPTVASPGDLLCATLALWTAAVTAVNLFPCKLRLGERVIHSDGWQLLTLWRLPEAKVIDRILQTSWHHVEALYFQGRRAEAWELQRDLTERYPARETTLDVFASAMHWNDRSFEEAARICERGMARPGILPRELLYFQVWAAASWVAEGQVERAERFCEEALAAASGAERVDLLDGFAGLPLTKGTHELLARASEWSEESLRLAPGKLTLLGTRGALLVEEGRLDEAEKLLRRVCSQSLRERDRGISWFFRAVIARRRGEGERQVHRLCRRAEWMCRELWLLERIYKLLDFNHPRAALPAPVPRPAL